MNKKGFTLIELLATITIIGVIMVILFPSVKNLIQNNENIQLDSVKKVLQSAADKYIVDERIDFKCQSKDASLQSKLNNTNINCLKFGNSDLDKYVSSYKVNNIDVLNNTIEVYVYCTSNNREYKYKFNYQKKSEIKIEDTGVPSSCDYKLEQLK